jgi:hypothetical protein
VRAREGNGQHQEQKREAQSEDPRKKVRKISCTTSYVSDAGEPNDVDVILVMRNDFRSEACPAESAVLFDRARAHDELGASVFWVRPDMLLGEPLERFLAFWQIKRDGRRRGVGEVYP